MDMIWRILVLLLFISGCTYRTIYDSSTPLDHNMIQKHDELIIITKSGEEVQMEVTSFDGLIIYGNINDGVDSKILQQLPLGEVSSIRKKR